MATPISSIPFQQRIPARNTLQRVLDLIIFSLLFLLLLYRLQSFNVHGVAWKLAFLCESWFTFVWILNMNAKWTPVDYTTYPERLLQWAGDELPPVDMFVTTADPVLEPPIITVNTVLSLLAVDYPAHKLACYVSDDGSSPLTFYSLVEASKFAKLWVPFCKKYDVQVTAPFMYFSTEPNPSSSSHLSSDFQWEWKKIKNEYEELSQRIEEAAQKPIPCDLTGEFEAFSNIEHGNHPSIIKVIWENKGNFPDGVPHLVYLSREKRPKNQHHYKAGALNVLTRVSGVMTNSPFMLNVDCDMFANNPKIVLMAMCHLLGSEKESESGFVLYPQKFHGASKDDPFGNQLVMLQHVVFRGLAGIQGPLCGGSGCFHRRKVIYGLSPDEAETKARYMSLINGKSPYEALRAKFGNSIELTESAGRVLFVMSENPNHPKDLLSSVKGAISVAACDYESNTQWGKQVGWVYGSTTEDVLTGLRIHSKGWKSIYFYQDPTGFLGCAPVTGPTTLTQMKRWSTGLLEILWSNNSPIIGTLTGKLQFRQCLGYLYILIWALRSFPEMCYTLLPAYSIFTNTNFLPTVSEPAFFVVGSLFVVYNLSTLSEYLRLGLPVRAWWNNQKMARIQSSTAWLFGLLAVILKLLGISETVFTVTRKDQSTPSEGNGDTNSHSGWFTFDESPIFVPATTLLLVHLTALALASLRVQPFQTVHAGWCRPGIGEIICSTWIVLSFLPFLKGLFRRGIYGIRWSILYKSTTLALLFMYFSMLMGSKVQTV
ncbi:cellulose synthase-like protein H1 isoform X1 [Macadamia integrifolia]|uniref:cellulose synthase-like protein H1 isoform X1 n=1 Tax=Macadamia integrifolia TaxID=60698 RepID=UPI001C52B8BD|nr:cellulose synthase-like protein H1 isoform X1 [Macadamia integrifolia]